MGTSEEDTPVLHALVVKAVGLASLQHDARDGVIRWFFAGPGYVSLEADGCTALLFVSAVAVTRLFGR